jgi:FkbM family methyltransferase
MLRVSKQTNFILRPLMTFLNSLGRTKKAVLSSFSTFRNASRLVSQTNCNPEFHGNPKYGGWAICPTLLSHKSIIYSVGVGEDISFDLSVIQKFGCRIYAFDPTPRSKAWLDSQDLPPQLTFFQYGLAHYDGTAMFYPPDNPLYVSHSIIKKSGQALPAFEAKVFTVSTLANMLGHNKIDLLKMDIEGAEYEVIDDIVGQSGIKIDQILVEFHSTTFSVSKSIGKLKNAGYGIFWISPNKSEFGFVLT